VTRVSSSDALAIRRLGPVESDIELGRVLVREYTRATWEEARSEGVPGMPDRYEALERMLPDAGDFAGAYLTVGCAYLVAERAGEAVGGVGIQRYEDAVAEMKRLWVRPADRGTGAGRAIAAAAIDESRRLGYREMVLDVVPYRTVAIALYRSLGFVETADLHEYPFEMSAFRLQLADSSRCPDE
jgi:ribosomal protein S18 acetylase RimI-like enzyme